RIEGAGNAGCWPHPQGLACKENAFHARKHNRAAETAGTPCAMVYGLYAVSSVHRAFWPPSPRVFVTRGLIPASGDRDNATSPSASNAPVLRADTSIASRSQRS